MRSRDAKAILVNRIRKKVLPFLNHQPISQRVSTGIAASHSMLGRKETFKNLWDSEFQVFSQFGEDGIIDYLLEIVNISKPRILEIGAGDFSECNSRFALHKRLGSAYLVDMKQELRKGVESSGLSWKTTIQTEIEKIEVSNVAALQNRALNFMSDIDLISIDIDGIDYWVARELDWNNVKIAVVEYNPVFGHRRAVSVPLHGFTSRFDQHFSGLYFGASLKAWINLMEESGLIFIGSNRVGNNAFFIRREFCKTIPFDLPNIQDLSRFVDWRVRDSRSEDGKLTYLNTEEIQNILRGMELVDTVSMERVSLSFPG
jgi:hypothetical protein